MPQSNTSTLSQEEDLALKSSALSAADALRAVLANQSNPDTWIELGNALPNGVSAEVEGAYFDSCTCFFEALKLSDKKNARAWVGLGASLSKHLDGQFDDGEEVSQKQCFVRSLELDASSVSAWMHLGACLNSTETVCVNGKEYSANECLSKASFLKAALHVQKKQQQTQKQNTNSSLDDDHENGNDDVDHDNIENEDEEFTRKSKSLRRSSRKSAIKFADVDFDELAKEEEEKLRGAPEYPSSFWLQLAEALTNSTSSTNSTNNNTNITKPQDENRNNTITKETVNDENDENNSTRKSLNNNNNNKTTFQLDGLLEGKEITRLMCYEKAVESDSRNSHLWLALEGALADEERKLKRQLVSQEDVVSTYFQGHNSTLTIEDMVNPEQAKERREKERQEIERKKQKEREEKQKRKEESIAYFSSSSDEDDEEHEQNAQTSNKNKKKDQSSIANPLLHCFVFGEKLTRRDCILRAIDLDKNNSEAWLRLATEHLVLDDSTEEEMIAPDEETTNRIRLLDGETKVTHRIAAEKAALLAPNNSNAWVMVAACLAKAKQTSSTFFVPPDLVRNYNNSTDKNSSKNNSSSTTATTTIPFKSKNNTYTALQCLERAVSLDSCNVKAWIALAKMLSVMTVKEQQYQQKGSNTNKKNDKVVEATATVYGQEGKSSSLSILMSKASSVNFSASSSSSATTTKLVETKVTAKYCLEKALSLNPTLGAVWKKLALLLAAESSSASNDASSSAFFQKASSSSSKRKVIATLRNKLPNVSNIIAKLTGTKNEQDQPTATVRGEKLDLKQVLMKCVQYDSASSDAWLTLGTFLASTSSDKDDDDQTVSTKEKKNNKYIIPGFNNSRPIDTVFCFVKTVELDPFSVEGWTYLAASMTSEFVDVNDEVHSRADCFEQAKKVDLRGMDGWLQKGFSTQEEEREEEKRIFQVEKEKMVLEINAALLREHDFGKKNSASSSGRRKKNSNPETPTTPNDPSTQPFTTSPPSFTPPPAIKSIPNSDTKNNNSRHLTKEEYLEEQIICFHRAATLEPTDYRGWAYLGSVLPSGRKIKVLEEFYSNVECIVKAIELDSSQAICWFFLGKTLKFGERVFYTRNSDSNDDVVLANTGEESSPKVADQSSSGKKKQKNKDSSVTNNNNNKAFVDRLLSFKKAVELEPTNALYWMHLGIELLPKRKQTVDICFNAYSRDLTTETYDKQRCLEKAVEIDPKLSLAWTHLSMIDPDRDDQDDDIPDVKFAHTVDVASDKKVYYSRDDCYFRGLESAF